MNERIRELELRATVYADSKVPANRRYNDIYYNIVCGKFAELVIEETCNIVLHYVNVDEGVAVAKRQLGVNGPKIVKVTLADALALGREDFACPECPDDCSKCEHYDKCVYPVMD